MRINHTTESLIAFEEEVCQWWINKMIRAPIHLDNGCESQMIHIFENYVDEEDWVCCSWRSHYRCLLKGVPQEEMKKSILLGKSISLCFPEYRVISSGIVAGILPIALGIALGIKMREEKNKVVVFVGDMTSQHGIFHECYQYARNHSLPILFACEDNNKSVCSDTREAWGCERLCYQPRNYVSGTVDDSIPGVLYFQYESKYEHAGLWKGAGRIQF